MKKHWKENGSYDFGKTGEKAVKSYLLQQEAVADIKDRDYKGMKDYQISKYETHNGDLDVITVDDAMVKVEVKSDDMCQFTGNIQFEVMNHWNGDDLSHSNIKGWWYPGKTTAYSVLIFAMVNDRSIQIDNVNEARKWCQENKHLFQRVENNYHTKKTEGKNTINIRCSARKFVEACPYAKWIDIDTTIMDEFVKSHKVLKERRQRYIDRYRNPTITQSQGDFCVEGISL